MSPQEVEQAILRRWPSFVGTAGDLDDWLGLPEGTTERIVANLPSKKEGP